MSLSLCSSEAAFAFCDELPGRRRLNHGRRYTVRRSLSLMTIAFTAWCALPHAQRSTTAIVGARSIDGTGEDRRDDGSVRRGQAAVVLLLDARRGRLQQHHPDQPRDAGRGLARAGTGAHTRCRGLRRDADHRPHRRQRHERPAALASQYAARGSRRGRALLHQRPQRPALHLRQGDQTVLGLSRLQRRRGQARNLPQVDDPPGLRQRAERFQPRPRLREERQVLHGAHRGSLAPGVQPAE